MGKGKFATLTVTQPYYVYFSGTTRAALGLVVKKGSVTFEVRVYGIDLDKAKPVAKTLAQNAAGKL